MAQRILQTSLTRPLNQVSTRNTLRKWSKDLLATISDLGIMWDDIDRAVCPDAHRIRK